MKRVLSLVLAMAMILSSFSFAFALPSDVEGTDYADAVARLTALDIIVGYEDGTFKPDNSITRAEFAAIVIRALGMEDIAVDSVDNTKFADMRGTHWASGYVNLATAQGIIVGYPDGTFKPEAQVTYSEAVAMLVRLLGYEPALNSNVWPSNYLTKASEVGLTLGVKFNYNDPAKRGVVSNLVNKALDIDLMDLTEVTSGDQTWKITDDTLLTKYLNVFELEEAYVAETASHSLTKLDADEVKIKTEAGKTYTFKKIDSIDADAVLGHEVTVFVRDTDTDGKIEDDELVISIQDTTDARDVIAWDWIVDITESDEDNYKIKDGGIEIALDEIDDEFEIAEDAIVFYNYERVTDLEDMASSKVGVGYAELGEVAGKVILNDDDDIIFMDMVNYDSPVVITDVNLKDEKVKYFMYSDSESTLKLDGEDYVVMKNGEVADLEALAADDVLYFWEVSGAYVLEAYDYKIEGILDSVDSDNNMYWDYTLVVDGKSISVGPAFTMSTDENDTIDSLATNPGAYEWVADDDRLSDLEDMVGENVVVYIGKYYEETEGWNYGRHVTTAVNTGDDDYYVVTVEPWASRTAGYKYYVELINQFGDDITYEFTEDETEFNGAEEDLSVSATMNNVTAMLPQGTLVDVEFNSDGTISAIDVVEEIDNSETFDYKDIDDDYDRIKIGGKIYYVSDETVFYGVAVNDLDTMKFVDADAYTWADIADINSGSFKAVSSSDDNELEAMVFYYEDSEDFALGKNDYGYVLKREIRKEGLYVFMAVEDEIVEYYAGDLSKSTQNSLQEKVLVNFTASGNDLDKANKVDRTIFYADADEMTNNMFKVVAGVEVTTGSSIKAATVDKNDIKLDDVVIAKWNTTDGKLDNIAEGYKASDFSFEFDKFEIVSGGVDTKNGIIEVMAVGTDEDEDMTWFVDVDKYGNESFYYDVDISHRNLENKILSLGDLTDGDMLHIYDVPEETVTEYISVYDR
ncbi:MULTISPECIES: S-layer homology domain-containing protein [unclassified Sedimentibacter]|uniref:S-layer homology domain-containing protein n=1 Tax=unclassified Sedimentibacter TaxID=2649220 RepID=UPI0027E091C9|nr:S-layer homology domain-containing protein [Sedimentibacter sp. MB35-C1]WMJ76928.1 S-layer homology domain-containing protein [Sedimentibacter sp. MB35-C1]